MCLRTLTISILCVYGQAAYSDNSLENISLGVAVCEGWERTQKYYQDNPENIFAQDAYATCLFIKGKLQDNQAEVNEAIAMLYHLADHSGHIMSNNFIATYLATDGDMTSYGAGVDNLDASIRYYQNVLSLIASTHGHYATRNDDYYLIEWNTQMELQSYIMIPYLYLQKYCWGVEVIPNLKTLDSPCYTGDRNIEVVPQYANSISDSLTRMKEAAQNCLSLPLKEHFKPPAYESVQEACQNYKRHAENLLN